MDETAKTLSALDYVTLVSDFIWGGTWGEAQLLPFAPMVIVLFGAGIYFMVRLGFYPILKLPAAFAGIFKKEEGAKGEISPFAALSTALSGQVGTGNLAGVATAITLGGPGALFWMWVTALLGMALAFAEGSLAVRFRDIDANGAYRGGPMTYIRRGLGKSWGWLSILFCVGTLFSSISTGNMIQANGLADAITGLAPAVPEWVAGLVIAVLVFLVIIGGIKSIGSVAEKVVPTMALAYVVLALTAVLLNIRDIPQTFVEIFGHAFSGRAAVGGFLGSGVMLAIRAGVARGLFSNEAGQGSTPIAHAVAQTHDPARQGRFAMMGTFIDTIVICTMTGLVILTVEGAFPHVNAAGVTEMQTHAWTSDLRGFALTSAAFGAAFPLQLFAGVTLGQFVASIALILFAFTTLITWGYYGERAATYLFGQKLAIPWRLLWCAMAFVGSFQEIDFVWRLGDISNAAMAFPNIIALLALSGVVVALAKGDRTAGVDHGDEEGVDGPAPAAPGDPVP
jgi:AGCS family alanine or glycine:cation symporter